MGFSPLIAGLIGHVILTHKKLIWLVQWTCTGSGRCWFRFCFCDSADSKSESLGRGADADQYGCLISAQSFG